MEDSLEAPTQRARRPIVIGAHWKRRAHKTYDYIHEMRESYYRPMTEYLSRRAGAYPSAARRPEPSSFAERALAAVSDRHGGRPARAESRPERSPPPPPYRHNTFSDDLLAALGVPLPDLSRYDMKEDPVMTRQLKPHRFNNHVPDTQDKILLAMGVRPRDFSELPDVLEPTLTLVPNDPALQRTLYQGGDAAQ